MAGDKESGLAQSHESNACFEAIGSRGFASLGAALGLAFSLVLVWATAPSLPAAPSRPKTSPVVQAEKPPSEEVKASVTANCTFPELSASCDSAHEALNEPADFSAQAPY